MTKPTIELLSASLELIEPVNFPLYEFSGRSEGEVTHWRNSYLLYYLLLLTCSQQLWVCPAFVGLFYLSANHIKFRW